MNFKSNGFFRLSFFLSIFSIVLTTGLVLKRVTSVTGCPVQPTEEGRDVRDANANDAGDDASAALFPKLGGILKEEQRAAPNLFKMGEDVFLFKG